MLRAFRVTRYRQQRSPPYLTALGFVHGKDADIEGVCVRIICVRQFYTRTSLAYNLMQVHVPARKHTHALSHTHDMTYV